MDAVVPECQTVVTPSASSEAGAGLSSIFVSYLCSCDRFFPMDRNKLCYLCISARVRTHVCVDIYEIYNVAGLCVYEGGCGCLQVQELLN